MSTERKYILCTERDLLLSSMGLFVFFGLLPIFVPVFFLGVKDLNWYMVAAYWLILILFFYLKADNTDLSYELSDDGVCFKGRYGERSFSWDRVTYYRNYYRVIESECVELRLLGWKTMRFEEDCPGYNDLISCLQNINVPMRSE